MLGNSRITRDHSRSAAVSITAVGCSVIIVVNGASAEGSFTAEDDPMCKQMTMPSSSQAFQNGSQ